jgi:hypothetical protein
MRISPHALWLALVFCLAGASQPACGAPDGPAVELAALGAAPARGRLVGLGPDGVRFRPDGAGEDRTVPLGQVLAVHLPDAQGEKVAGLRFRAVLVGGDELIGALAGASELGLRLDVEGAGPVDISFERLSSLEALPADAGPCTRELEAKPPAESGDIAYDEGNDEYPGTVLQADASTLVIQDQRGRKRSIEWKRLRVLHLENERVAPGDGLQGEVELATGSRIALGGVPRWAGTGLAIVSRSAAEVRWTIPFTSIRSLRWWGERFVYASMLPIEHTRTHYYGDSAELLPPELVEPYFGLGIDGRRDHRVGQHGHCPLRLDGRSYRRGFAVNPHSRIEIDLARRFATFQCDLGIDDSVLEAAAQGEVDARVIGDGKVLWEAAKIVSATKPRRVGPLDVSGVERLVLEVGFGKDDGYYALDRADWADPILVRK